MISARTNRKANSPTSARRGSKSSHILYMSLSLLADQRQDVMRGRRGAVDIAYPLGPGIHGRHIHTRMCAMIAMTVKPMKLVTNKEWNSLASASVSPDKDDLSLPLALATSFDCRARPGAATLRRDLRHDRRSRRLRRSDVCNIDLAIRAHEVAIEACDCAGASRAKHQLEALSCSCLKPATTRCAPSTRSKGGSSAQNSHLPSLRSG